MPTHDPHHGSLDTAGLHCPSCGYALTGLQDPRCPECSEPFDLEQLQQRRLQAPPSFGVGRAIVHLVWMPAAYAVLCILTEGLALVWGLPLFAVGALVNAMLLTARLRDYRQGSTGLTMATHSKVLITAAFYFAHWILLVGACVLAV